MFANSGFGIDARHKGIMNGENYDEPWWALPNFEIHYYEELQRCEESSDGRTEIHSVWPARQGSIMDFSDL